MTPLPEDRLGKLIRPGSRIFIGSGVAAPLALIDRVLAEAADIGDLQFVNELLVGRAPWQDVEYETVLRVNALGLDSKLPDAGRQVEYTPCMRYEAPPLFVDQVIRPDVALVMVSPPDTHGYCSLGPVGGSALAACQTATTVMAQINPSLPRTYGQSFLHKDRIAYYIEEEAELAHLPEREVSDAHLKIGSYIEQLVEDGVTLQIGAGPLATAVAQALSKHRNLGLHTQVFSDPAMELMLSGALDNSVKNVDTGLSVASWAAGSNQLYKFLHENPHIQFRPVDLVSHPRVLSRIKRLVAINIGLTVDLTGQVTVEPNPMERVASADIDFIRGAGLSEGGSSIIALPSTSGEGEDLRSRIVIQVDAAAGVGSTRVDVHHVVTEYGIATLNGRSLRQRVMELIQVAHPQFRESLLQQAREHRLVPGNFNLPPPYEQSKKTVVSRRVRLADGQRYLLRPLNPSDDQRLQHFFYTHTEDTINRRYGFTITRMSQQRAYELVSVDQNKDLALGIFEMQGPREIIHAVGRYYLDKKGKSGEMAFVVGENKRRVGMARTLLEEMIEVATARGLKHLWAQVDRDNHPMLRLFQKYSAQIKPGEEPNTVKVTIELEPEEAGGKPGLLERLRQKR